MGGLAEHKGPTVVEATMITSETDKQGEQEFSLPWAGGTEPLQFSTVLSFIPQTRPLSPALFIKSLHLYGFSLRRGC